MAHHANGSSGCVTHAGIRTSRYGIDPYPSPQGWHAAIHTMQGYFPGATPCAIWTTGAIRGRDCHLYFPNDRGYEIANVTYEQTDLNEDYLSYFDQAGIKVYLQIEPAHADMHALIDMVLTRYGKHPSLIGFGVDVEWFESEDHPWGRKVSDELARQWESWVKAHESRYRLFLKHPDRTPSRFPDTYRGEIVFVNDCEGLDVFEGPKGFADYRTDFLGVMATFAGYCYPNPVFYQIGYPSIKSIYPAADAIPRTMGQDLSRIVKPGQEVGIFWVDFGMKGILPLEENWQIRPWSSRPNAG
jgi:hypothetical protein